MKQTAQTNNKEIISKRDSSFSMSFDPAEKIALNNDATKIVDWEPKTIRLVENGEGTTEINLSFQFNGYDDVLSVSVPVTVDLPESTKVLDFTLELSKDDLNNFESLGLAFYAYQPIPACIKLLEPVNNLALPEYSHNYKSYTANISEVDNPDMTIIRFTKPSLEASEYNYSIYNIIQANMISNDIEFINCNKYLTKLIFNNLGMLITTLSPGKFKDYINLADVVLPNALVEIPNNLFDGCTNLTSINIPKNVSAINETAFINCPALTEITVDNASSIFSSKNGILYSKDEKTLIKWPENNSVNIVDQLKNINTISNYAFSGVKILSTLDNVILPNNILSIGSYAFANSCIKKITLPESLSIDISSELAELPVGIALFDSLTNTANGLNNIIIDVKCPVELITRELIGDNTSVDLIIHNNINNYQFFNSNFICNLSVGTELTDAEDLLISIGDSSFSNSTLQTLTLGKKVDIQPNAFSNCLISEIIIDSANEYYKLSNNVLYEYSSEYDFELSAMSDPIPTRIILGLPSVSKIEINNSINLIDTNAFSNCNNLTSVVFIDKSLDAIRELPNYPWGISNINIITSQL